MSANAASKAAVLVLDALACAIYTKEDKVAMRVSLDKLGIIIP